MHLKKFLVPNLLIVLILASLNFMGIEDVFKSNNDDTINFTKYIQAKKSIITNYYGDTDIQDMYEASVRNMVESLDDSTLKVSNTPIDTTFSDLNITSLRESYSNFEKAYTYIANTKPDANMDLITEAAIRGMFSTLDPHSVYIEAEDNERIQDEFAGKFFGIGVSFNIIDDTVTVVTAISGGPSDQLGIRSGDRIIAIEDSSSVGFGTDQVISKLRGEKGTPVDVTIKRPKVKEPLEFTIVRDEIPLYTVDTSYMLDEKSGYIKVNRFAATTHDEFMDAMDKLKGEGMERLILDLRNNPGGYLQQAVAIAEEFFPKGEELLKTKSRHNRFNAEYYSRRDGAFEGKPVIILVDEGSASASEIVSGAIQDHDRGLVVGKRTFGKGLVQQQYELADKSSIRVTISRYYTPSGRLIQKPITGGKEDYAYEIYRRKNDAMSDAIEFIDEVPDSLKYYTDAGRVVYGGGGIVPDYIIPDDTTQSAYVVNFSLRERIPFNFVRDFLDEKSEEFRAEWESDFQNFRENFEWNESHVTDMKNRLLEAGMFITDTVDTPSFRNDTLFVPEGHFEETEWMIKGQAKAQLAQQVWGSPFLYPIFNDTFDTTLEEAVKLWDAVERLEKLKETKAENNIGNLKKENE